MSTDHTWSQETAVRSQKISNNQNFESNHNFVCRLIFIIIAWYNFHQTVGGISNQLHSSSSQKIPRLFLDLVKSNDNFYFKVKERRGVGTGGLKGAAHVLLAHRQQISAPNWICISELNSSPQNHCFYIKFTRKSGFSFNYVKEIRNMCKPCVGASLRTAWTHC